MPSSCSAIGCTRRCSKEKGIKMYRFPADPQRRHLWIRALKRKRWQPNESSRVCNAHFASGILMLNTYLATLIQLLSSYNHVLFFTQESLVKSKMIQTMCHQFSNFVLHQLAMRKRHHDGTVYYNDVSVSIICVNKEHVNLQRAKMIFIAGTSQSTARKIKLLWR